VAAMKNDLKHSIALVSILLLAGCSKSGDSLSGNPAGEGQLIAYYPLKENGQDSTGLNVAMTLQNAPFENGGVYSNGGFVYTPGPQYCLVESPAINSFPFESFAISMDFFVTEKFGQSVWIIGKSCRWLGFSLSGDGTVAMLYNNWDYLFTKKTYSVNQWHNAKISYDGTTAKIFLDNDLAGSLKLGNAYVPLNYSLCGPSDTEITVTNYSNGSVFKGYVKNLKVHRLQ
jgi:hypothetical protein